MLFEETISKKSVIIVSGSGGVGKTTVAAALALKAAKTGLQTLVCTIDPANRLADSMGLSSLGNEEQRVPERKLAGAGLDPELPLSAMMLETGRTFDALIARHAPTPEIRDRIYGNKLYTNLSASLAGSREYMSMEKLYELKEGGRYDLIVMDTPPTRQALDFLEAPRRMLDFFNANILRWLLNPPETTSAKGFKLFRRGGEAVAKRVERLLGVSLVTEIIDFFRAFEGLYEGFAERAAKVQDILTGEDAVFFLVSGSDSVRTAEGIYFYDKLREYNMPFSTVIFNMVHETASFESEKRLMKAAERVSAGTGIDADRLASNYKMLNILTRKEYAAIDKFREKVEEEMNYYIIPAYGEDIHDLRALDRLGSGMVSFDSD